MPKNIEDYIHATNQATDPEALFQLFLNELEALGLDRVVYSFMTDSPVLKKKAQHGVVRNYPEDWMKRYAEKNYIAYDPVYKTAFISRKPFTWQDINEQQPLKPIQRKVMAEAREAGLKDGVALSIQGSSGEIIGVGMASSDGGVDLSKDAVSKIYMIVNQFHLCYSDLISENVPLSINNDTFLSKREREVLIWSGQNKSTADIADIMGVSAKTIEFHLANIYKKLGVNGRILAVIKALHHGLISL